MPLLTPHVPKGLIELMKDLAKEVLRDKPENIYEFAIVHFEKLILERDGRLDKGYEEFTAFENFFDGQQRFAVPSNCGYICQKPIKIQAIPQPRKSKADIMASFQAMESINEEDVLAPAPEAENPYADEKYQNAIYVIQRYFRRYVARKKENEGNPNQTQVEESQTLSAFTAAIIIQRTMRRLFSNKIKLKKDKDLGTALAAATTAAAVAAAATVKLVQDDVDNVSEAASYTSSSTIQMLADGQEGRENRLASAQSRRQREEVSDGDGDEDGENGVGVDVVGAVADFSSIEFKEPTQDVEELEPPSSSSVEPAEAAATLAVVAADDEDDEKEHSHSSVAMATEADRKSIADENGNTTVIPEETTNPASASTTDDTSTAHNIGILSTKIGSNYNHQNLTNTKTHNEIDTNTSRTSQPPPTTTQIYNTKQQLLHQIIPAGLSVPLNSPQFSSSMTTSSSSSLLGATPTKSPHLEETQETLTVHRFHDYGNGNANENENPNGKTNDASLPPPYFQGDGRIRKFDSDTGGESLKIYDVFYHQDTSINDQEFSDSLNESTMEKDSLEPEELDADSLESNENVMHHHMSEIVKRDAKQDDGSLYGDKNDDEEKEQEEDDNDNDNAQSMQKFIEIERVPTYLYGIHPARTPVVERRNKSRNCEEAQSKVPDDEKKYLEVTVDSKTPDEKSEENSLESKGSTSEESSVTQIENNLQHQQSEIENKGSKLNEVSDNDGKVPTKSPESQEKLLNIEQKASSLIPEEALLRENEINLEKSNEMVNHKVEESGQNALEMSSSQAFDGTVTSCEDVNQQNETNLSLNNGPSSSNSHIKSNSETTRLENETILEVGTKSFEAESANAKQEANESEKTLNSCDNMKENDLVPSVKSNSEKLIDSERETLPKNTEESNFHQENHLKLVSLDSNQSECDVEDSKDEVEKFICNESISPNSKSSEDQPKIQTHIEKISTQLTDDESARMKPASQSEALKNEEDCIEDQTKIHTHTENNPIHLSNDDSEMMKTSKNEEDIVEDHLKIHTQNEKNITNLPDDGSEIIKSAGQSAPLKNGEDMLEDQPKIQNDIANKSIHLSDENSESMKTADVLKSDEAIIEDQLKIQTHIENNASHLSDKDSETINIAGQSEALKNDEDIVLQEQHKENIEKYVESSSKDIKTESIQNSVLETSLNSKTIEDQNKNLLDHDQEIESQLQELQNLNDDLHPVENAHHVMSADTKNDNISQHNGKNNMEDSFNQSNELKITNETKNNEDSTIKISKNPPTEILNSSNIAEDELSKLNASANSKISDSNQIEKSEDYSTEKCQNTHKEEECNVIEVDKTELNDLSEASKETIEEEDNQISKEKVMPEEDKKHKEKSLKSDSQSEEDVDKIFKDNSKEGELEMKLGTTNNLVSLKETNEGADAKVSQKAPSMHSNMEETEELKEDQTTLRKNSNEDTNFIKGLNYKEKISDANLVEISKTITEDHQSDIKTKEDHHLSVENTGNQKKNTLKGEDPDKESHENEKENTKLFDSEDLHATQDQDKALKLTGKDQTSNECTSLDFNIEENRIKTLKENEAAERSILEKAKSNEGIASDITSENIEDSLNKKILTGILNETNMPISSETNEETNKQNEDVQEKTLADKEVSSEMKETEAENDKEIEEPKPSSNNSPNNTDPEKENTFQGTSPSNDNIFNEPHSLKKPDNIDSIPSASPENIGCDGSSAETSADFSSIGKDLEFFEDTIKYLKNATEHLGGMEDVFDSKKVDSSNVSKDTDILNNSAVLIQSAFRGYQIRRELKELEKINEFENGSRKKRSLDQEESSSDSNEEKNVKAAIKIQSAYRGHRVRKNLKEKPNKETTESIEDLQSPSRHILASNSLKSQIPVAVIHPTKYSNSSEEDKTEKVAGIRNTTTSRNSFNSNQKNSKTSPHKTTSLKRQKPIPQHRRKVQKKSMNKHL
ncbi:kinesin-related protein 4-like [Episyrphus balteatus]|uniref:kinesin-related protein 4-like n=1 Tax=Episyrphus balteatus TaxID=286459 RepID=UPI00248533CB|nr:kinesin-related protein 4-like [Episyrphus balteatus]